MSDTGMDVGKIISIIMENPGIIEQISALANKTDTPIELTESTEADATPTVEDEAPTQISEEVSIPTSKTAPSSKEFKRRNLIGALKPYLSPERAQAADSILGVASILEIIKK